MSAKYNPNTIEPKWQKYWEEHKLFHAKTDAEKEKFYALVEFPYPSGEGLHTGHVRGYTAMDIVARKRRMEGQEVMYPIGWDAFGLPTENYAVKTGIHPEKVTKKNTDTFRRQMKALGFSFDWSREINTTDPAYYKWTQWIFLQLFKHDLAYKAKMDINWCPSCRIGLANEEAIGGVCERCGGPTEKREKEQWMLAITKYADRLDRDLDTVDYPDRVKIQQRNWIGRSDGVMVKFKIADSEEYIEVFTTRVDTIFGCTYVVVAPEHGIILNSQFSIFNREEVKAYIDTVKKKTEQDRLDATKEKTGVKLEGVEAVNPFTGKAVPIFVADYVLGNYGTGAVMAVPTHDERDWEFAKKYGLLFRQSVWNILEEGKECFVNDGVLVDSGEFTGLHSDEAREKMTEWLEKEGLGKRQTNYKLRDWVFSRQRYWGEPIPLVHCAACGWVAVPEEELPVKLPMVESYVPTETGESPLAAMEGWVKTVCPTCGGEARRETDTMPNWAGSSWYYLRYTDPRNTEALASKEALAYWMGPSTHNTSRSNAGGVDWYNGGMEHTTLHLLYSRFWHKFLFDIGIVPTSEPYTKRTSHGLILAEGGVKMSKSKGNVVNPDDIVRRFGADTLRIYEMFMGPFDQAVAWSEESIAGSRRFLEKVWKMQERIGNQDAENEGMKILSHKTIKKVSEDIEAMRFNTAVSALMIFANEMEKLDRVPMEVYLKFLILLSPFAPHIAEELWERIGETSSLLSAAWPRVDSTFLKEETTEIVVQVNGKLRARLCVSTGALQEDVERLAREEKAVQQYLENATIRNVIFVPNRLVNFVI